MNTATPLDTLSPDTHDQVWASLPWYLNGTLDSTEHELVQQHLKVCIPCRNEMATQQHLQQSLQIPATNEFGEAVQFSRLMNRIHATKPDMPTRIRPQKRPFWAQPWPQIAAIAAMLVAIFTAPINSLLTPAETIYQTLTASTPKPVVQQTGDIRVIFSSTVDAQRKQLLLSAIDGQVVHPADANGIHVVQVNSQGRATADEIDLALATLRDDPQVIFAEPITVPGLDSGS